MTNNPINHKLESIAKKNDVPFELIQELLQVERNRENKERRIAQQPMLEQIIKKYIK